MATWKQTHHPWGYRYEGTKELLNEFKGYCDLVGIVYMVIGNNSYSSLARVCFVYNGKSEHNRPEFFIEIYTNHSNIKDNLAKEIFDEYIKIFEHTLE